MAGRVFAAAEGIESDVKDVCAKQTGAEAIIDPSSHIFHRADMFFRSQQVRCERSTRWM